MFINSSYDMGSARPLLKEAGKKEGLIERVQGVATASLAPPDENLPRPMPGRKIVPLSFSLMRFINEIYKKLFKKTDITDQAFVQDFDAVRRKVYSLPKEWDPQAFVNQVKAELFLEMASKEIPQGRDLKEITSYLNYKTTKEFEAFLQGDAGDLSAVYFPFSEDQKMLLRLYRKAASYKVDNFFEFSKSRRFEAISDDFHQLWATHKEFGVTLEAGVSPQEEALPVLREENARRLEENIRKYIRERFDGALKKYQKESPILAYVKAYSEVFGNQELLLFDCRRIAENSVRGGAKRGADLRRIIGNVREPYETQKNIREREAGDAIKALFERAQKSIIEAIRYNIGEAASQGKDPLQAALAARESAIDWWIKQEGDIKMYRSQLEGFVSEERIREELRDAGDLQDLAENHEKKRRASKLVQEDFQKQLFLINREMPHVKNQVDKEAIAWLSVSRNKMLLQGAAQGELDAEIDQFIKEETKRASDAYGPILKEQLEQWREWQLALAHELAPRDLLVYEMTELYLEKASAWMKQVPLLLEIQRTLLNRGEIENFIDQVRGLQSNRSRGI